MKRGVLQLPFDREDHRIEPLEVADLQHAAAPGGGCDQSAGLGGGRRDRLLDQHVGAGLEEIHRDRVMRRGGRRDADRIDGAEQLAVIRVGRDAEFGADAIARLRRRVGDAGQLAAGETCVLLGVEAAEVTGADDGAAQTRHAGASIAVRRARLPRCGARLRLARMAWNNPATKWYAGLSPSWRRELRLAGLLFGFGLIVMPFLIYFAGVLTLDAYEGGLLSFLGALLGAFFTLTPSGLAAGRRALPAVHRRAFPDASAAPPGLSAAQSLSFFWDRVRPRSCRAPRGTRCPRSRPARSRCSPPARRLRTAGAGPRSSRRHSSCRRYSSSGLW